MNAKEQENHERGKTVIAYKFLGIQLPADLQLFYI